MGWFSSRSGGGNIGVERIRPINYENIKDLPVVERTKAWIEKISRMRVRFEEDKYKAIKNIDNFYKNRNYEGLQAEITELENIILKRQIPLYNNVINAGANVYLPILARSANEAGASNGEIRAVYALMSEIFVNKFEQMRTVLKQQADLFARDISTTKGFFLVLSNADLMIKQEQEVFASIVNDMKKLKRKTKALKVEINKILRQNRKLAKNYMGDKVKAHLDMLQNSYKLQLALSVTVFLVVIVLPLAGVSIGFLGVGVPWLYKITFKWLPAFASGDLSEAITDFCG
jgi:hypothetical protein